MTPLDYLGSIARGERPHPAHAALFGVRIVAVERGSLVLRWRPTAQLANPMGTIHGGFIAGVLDMAAGLSAATSRERFVHHITREMHIDFMTPARPGTDYEVVGRVVHIGRSSSLADAQVIGPDGSVARCRGTFLPNFREGERDGQGDERDRHD